MSEHNPVETGTAFYFREHSLDPWDSLYANDDDYLEVRKAYDTSFDFFDLEDDSRTLLAFDLSSVDLSNVTSARLRFTVASAYYEGNPYMGHALATPDVAFTVTTASGLPLDMSYHPGPGASEDYHAIESMETYFLALYPTQAEF